MATVPCSRCGKQLLPNQKYCSDCGTQNKQTVLLSPQNTISLCAVCGNPLVPGQRCPNCAKAPTLAIAGPIIPNQSFIPVPLVSAPVDIQNPTSDEIHLALISKTNPYASWGMLLYDDMQKHMWKSWSTDDERPVYAGSVFRVPVQSVAREIPFLADYNAVLEPMNVTPPVGSAPKKRNLLEILFAPPSPPPLPPAPKRSHYVRNFAFQVQVKLLQDKLNQAGLVFRADAAKQAYYCFSIYEENFSLATRGDKPLVEKKSDAIRVNKPNLLAVVVQEATIYLYINLHLVEIVEDTSLLHEGMVGINVSPYARKHIVEFSHAKVWVKE